MIVLDENIVEGQRLLLESWNVAARQVGLDVGRKGVKDEEIVVLPRINGVVPIVTGEFADSGDRSTAAEEGWVIGHR